MAMTNIEKIVRKVEADTLATDNERRAKAQALTQELATAKAALKDAERVPDAVLSAVKAGEDIPKDVAGVRLREARDAVEIARADVEGLTHRTAQATKRLGAKDASGAELLVPLFQRML